MSAVEEIKRLLRALIDRRLEEDISSQLRQLLELPLMTHREALEHHADLVAKARKGQRICHFKDHIEWTNGKVVYKLRNWKAFNTHVVRLISPENYSIRLHIGNDDYNVICPETNRDLRIDYMVGESRYQINSTPLVVDINIHRDGHCLYLSYDKNGMHVRYGCEVISNPYWKIWVDVTENVTVSRQNTEDVVLTIAPCNTLG
jgi:hypothetical protein